MTLANRDIGELKFEVPEEIYEFVDVEDRVRILMAEGLLGIPYPSLSGMEKFLPEGRLLAMPAGMSLITGNLLALHLLVDAFAVGFLAIFGFLLRSLYRQPRAGKGPSAPTVGIERAKGDTEASR